MSASWLLGPGRSPGACQTLVQVVPPSLETSTSARVPDPRSMKSLAHWIATLVRPVRSIDGVTRNDSSVLKGSLSQLLLTTA
jgi:hypothetical protein